MKKIIPVMFLAIFMIGIAYGACTFVSPTDSLVVSGSKLFNVTCTINNPLNCTLSASSSLGGDSGTVILYNTTTWLNATVDTTAFNDASDWTVTGTCYNASTSEDVTAITGVVVDNTVPTCSFDSALVSNTQYSPTQTWQITGTYATSVDLQFGSNSPYSMTESSDVFTYTGNVPESTYPTVSATASDGLNSTACTSLENIQIDQGATAKQVAGAISGATSAAGAKLAQEGNNTLTILLVVGIAAYFFSRKKK